MIASNIREITCLKSCLRYSLLILYVVLGIVMIVTFKKMSFDTSKYSCVGNQEQLGKNKLLRAKTLKTLNITHGHSEDNRGTFVIGILSNTDSICLREAQRKLFIPKAKLYKRFEIKVFFLLDDHTTSLDSEQKVNGDIVFLNTSIHGWSRGFAKKIHIWLNYVITHFPDAVLIGRMDDDVFACTPQIFDRLHDVKHKLLYYGYPTGYPSPCMVKDCVDEMFLIVGIDLARRVAGRNFCDDLKKSEKGCLKDGNGGHQFRHWIGIYKDFVFVDEKASNKMIWYFRGTPNKPAFKKFMTPMFCKKYLLFHKATPSEIYRWSQYNSLLFNDNSLMNVSEKDIVDADKCFKYNKH